jgi:hypothetical protein
MIKPWADRLLDNAKSSTVAMLAEINELRAVLGDLPKSQAEMLQEIKRLRAELSKVTDELFALSQDDGKIERALDRANAEIKKLRAELAKIKLQESVAWLNDRKTIAFTRFDMDGFPENIQAMYTTPLYLAPGAPPVKAGWVMVPVTPSPEMIIAGRNTPCNTTGDIIQDYIDLYKAMLAAAQKDNS